MDGGVDEGWREGVGEEGERVMVVGSAICGIDMCRGQQNLILFGFHTETRGAPSLCLPLSTHENQKQ